METVLYITAIAASVLFVVKTVLAVIGLGADLDFEPDGVDDGGLHFFTLHGILAFFAFGGWASVLALSSWGSPVLCVLAGLLAGVAMMALCALVMRSLSRLEASGNVDMHSAIGRIGEVYLTVPRAGAGVGKVNLVLNGGLRECEAVSREREPIEYGVRVRVVDLDEVAHALVVQRESEELA